MRNRLTTKFIERVSTPGTFPDGGGLFLQVQTRTDGRAAKSWVVRYRSNAGSVCEMGLGPLLLVPLADARMRALEARRKAYAGIDPIDERKEARAVLRSSSVKPITFQECAEIYISAHIRPAKRNSGSSWPFQPNASSSHCPSESFLRREVAGG